MKIQIVATVSANGYLASANDECRWWSFKKSYNLSALREGADLLLHKNTSLLSLLAEKQSNSDITYFAEATPDTIDLIKGLSLYRLADELFLYILPYNIDSGVPLSTVINPEEWLLVKEYPRRITCRIYQKKK